MLPIFFTIIVPGKPYSVKHSSRVRTTERFAPFTIFTRLTNLLLLPKVLIVDIVQFIISGNTKIKDALSRHP
jgi:hypothetical protein